MPKRDQSQLPKETKRLASLVAYFIFLALLLYHVRIGQLSWVIIAVSALAWFVIELRHVDELSRLRSAFAIGAFLLVFDFAFENLGWLSGLWQTFSALHFGVVPVEVMVIAFFGGTAWALYLPRKFNKWHSLADCLVFGFFGALGERLLILQGLFVYKLWWTSWLAFLAYFGTWALLHFVRYRVLKG